MCLSISAGGIIASVVTATTTAVNAAPRRTRRVSLEALTVDNQEGC